MTKLILLFLLSLQTLIVAAQWEFTNGPYGGIIDKIAQDSSGNLYSLSWDYSNRSLYKSTNMGESWFNISQEDIHRANEMVVASDGSIILVKETKLFRSTDEGESWNVLVEFPANIWDFTIHNGNLMVLLGSTGSFLYSSSDLGESWTVSHITNQHLSHLVFDAAGFLYSFQYDYNQNGWFFTSPDGIVWDSIEMASNGELVDVLTDKQNRLYLLYDSYTDKGIIRSSDGGISWDKIFDGPAESVFFNNNLIVLTKESGYFESHDDGNTWNQKINYYFLSEIIRLRDGDLIARSKDGIYISYDQSDTWQNISNGLLEAWIESFAVDDSGTIIVPTGVTHYNNLWKYTESEGTWKLISHEIPAKEYDVEYSGGFFWLRANDTLYKSKGNGEWNMVFFPSGTTRWSVSCANNGNCLFNTNTGLYWSPDFGDSLTLINVDPDLYAFTGATLFLTQDTAFVVLSVHNYKSRLLRASYIYRSIDGGLTWSQVVHITDDEYFAWDAQLIKDGAGNIYVGDAVYNNELFGSSDRGETWTLIRKPGFAYGIFADDKYLYANIYYRNIKRTNNFGQTWEDYDEGLPEESTYPMRAGVGSTSGYVYVFVVEYRYKGLESQPIIKGIYKRNANNDVTNVVSVPNIPFRLYPNPVTASFTIDYPEFNQKDSGFNLIDISGKQVKEIQVNKSITTVDVSDLKPGIYFLKGEGFSRKFTKF